MTPNQAPGKTWFPLACLALAAAVAAWSASLAAETEAERIDRLIRQLGSDSFAQREAAGKALEAIGTPALAALRQAAAGSADIEVRRRAGRLVEEVRRRSRPAALDCTAKDGASPAEVRRAQEAWAKFLGRKVEETVEIADGVKMTLVLVPPGKFRMGSPPDEKGRNEDETLHEVTLTEPFYLGKTEVTQAQYRALGVANPSRFKGADRPVETVSWEEASAWAEQLTKKHGGKHLYRLPAEAEWEYSCRGGRSCSQPFGIGDGRALSSSEANFNGNFPYGGADKGPCLEATRTVGSYKANALGLHDLHGNVWEWCQDWYGPYPDGAVTNPTGPAEGSNRVRRGGSWDNHGRRCRAADRVGDEPGNRDGNPGFRLARSFPSGVNK
jgi:formylglycine-generating enzyme required for sulfatase activity